MNSILFFLISFLLLFRTAQCHQNNRLQEDSEEIPPENPKKPTGSPEATNHSSSSFVAHKGDIMQFWDTNKNSLNELAYNAIRRDSSKRWTKYTDSDGNYILPYRISSDFSYSERSEMRDAMQEIESNTCIRFREHTNEADFVDIVQEYDNCFTFAGMCTNEIRIRENGVMIVGCAETGNGGFSNTLNLQKGWQCHSKRTYVHELMHKLGIFHEHNRADRDRYITIHEENIDPGFIDQFRMVDPRITDTYGISYDYASAMHYEDGAGALYSGARTITAKDSNFQHIMGQGGPTENDFKKICAIYECDQCLGRTGQRPQPTVRPTRRPILPSTEDDDDDDWGVPEFCDFCRPLSICSRLDHREFRYFYEMYCCGVCRETWRNRWCAQLSERGRQQWKGKGMCE